MLPANPTAPAAGRRFIRQKFNHLAGIEDLLLLVSEVVTNAVRHASQEAILLRTIERANSIRVEVRQLPQRFPTLNEETFGYGLRVVDALSESWGTGDPDWSGVWFEFDTITNSRHTTSGERNQTRGQSIMPGPPG